MTDPGHLNDAVMIFVPDGARDITRKMRGARGARVAIHFPKEGRAVEFTCDAYGRWAVAHGPDAVHGGKFETRACGQLDDADGLGGERLMADAACNEGGDIVVNGYKSTRGNTVYGDAPRDRTQINVSTHHLRALLDYAQPSEESDAAENGEEGHIIVSIRALRAALEA